MGVYSKIIKIKSHFRAYTIRYLVLFSLLLGYIFCLPSPLFNAPSATIIESDNGTLIGAKIAPDGQWRFPETKKVSPKFSACILHFEDQYFYKHFGFNPVSMLKAIVKNFQSKKIVRGGSTLTQQVIRLARKDKQRTYFEKLIELVMATRLELSYSKDEILNLYASHAPFGGNVVGIDMASWRYFGIPASQLSWAENATLAVLPNAPALIYPGKNQDKLLAKRNRLLRKLLNNSVIDSITYVLAKAEELPQKPFPLPKVAPHLLERLSKTNQGKRIQTSIDFGLQTQVNNIVNRYYQSNSQNGVNNMAVLVIDIDTRAVKTYVGNTATLASHQKDVDVLTSGRSTGSILKPLLYTAMLDKGELLPKQLVPDIPTIIAGYAPENFNETYSGAIAANNALARSLNIPAVRLLQQYGLHRFKDELDAFHLTHLRYTADHYGLSLILGGAEASLWDLCKVYAGLAGTLKHYTTNSSQYFTNEFISPSLVLDSDINFKDKTFEKPVFGAGSIWTTFEAMKNVNRPRGDEAWQFYDSSKQIAWKTGTSFGNRDAWAIGVNSNFVVGVWVGNADGEGRPELTGLNYAGPVLFDVFNLLPNSAWFATPHDDLETVLTCAESGFLASKNCPNTIKELVPSLAINAKTCKFHKIVHLTKDQKFQVNATCWDTNQMLHKPWFVLPTLQGHYYKNYNSDYKNLPPFHEDCNFRSKQAMQFIFPNTNSSVFLPKGFDGKTNELVAKLAHSSPDKAVYWYVDEVYIATTKQFHELPIKPTVGNHKITAIDEIGNRAEVSIVIKE